MTSTGARHGRAGFEVSCRTALPPLANPLWVDAPAVELTLSGFLDYVVSLYDRLCFGSARVKNPPQSASFCWSESTHHQAPGL